MRAACRLTTAAVGEVTQLGVAQRAAGSLLIRSAPRQLSTTTATSPLLRQASALPLRPRMSPMHARPFSTGAGAEQPQQETPQQSTEQQQQRQSAASGDGQQQQQQQQQQPEQSETEKLQKRVKELEEKLKEVNGDYLRALADIENMARINKTNVENAKLYSIKSFAEGMLEIADNLSRALEALPEEKRKLPDIRTFFEGVEMTERVLHQVFSRYGIKKFNPLNEKFDPTKCAALFDLPDPTKAPGTVAIVQAPGYTLHGRLLRAAQVGVVSAPPQNPPSPAQPTNESAQ